MNAKDRFPHKFPRVIFHGLILLRQTSAISRSRFSHQDSRQGIVQQVQRGNIMFVLDTFKLLLVSLLVSLFCFSAVHVQAAERLPYGIREAGLKVYVVSGAKIDVYLCETGSNNETRGYHNEGHGSHQGNNYMCQVRHFLVSRTTDQNGGFNFSFSEGVKVPENGEFVFIISPLNSPKNQEIRVYFTTASNGVKAAASGGPYAQSLSNIDDYVVPPNPNGPRIFTFTLIYVAPARGVLKGGFAVSGRSGT